MSTLLRVLILEDQPADAELMAHELRRAGFAPNWQRVDTESSYLASLDSNVDVILADYSLPQFDALQALRLLQAQQLDIPFLVVSGSIGEETAVEFMKQGAADYMLKDRLARLGQAVEHALYEKRIRKEKLRAEQEARQRTAQMEALRQIGFELVAELDLDSLLHSIAAHAVRLLGGASGGLSLYRPDRDVLEWVVSIATDPMPIGTIRRRGEGLSGKVWETGQPLIVNDYQSWEGQSAASAAYGYTAILGAPVRWGAEFLGVLAVNADAPRAFSPADAELLDLFATQAAIAIHNARLFRAEQEQFRRLQESQTQLIQVEKMAALGRLVASIAHEINNPLQAMQGSLELAEEELQGDLRPDKLARFLRIARSEIERLATTVRRLRDFYRPAREGLQPTDVNAIAQNVLELVGKQLQHSRVTVECEQAGDLPMLQANPDYLKQVFLNLVLNAIDAMGERGGTLRVRTALDQMPGRDHRQLPAVRIEFSDTGDGIPPDMLDHIFEPFVTTKKTGTGLGLSISYGLIEAHNGRITVTSEVGVGTTFTILLPVGAISRRAGGEPM